MDLRTDDVSRPVEAQESAPTPPRPKKPMFDWASYNPSGSVSRFEQSLELGTSIGQRFFGSWYLRVMSASVMLTDVMPRAMKSKQQAQEVMDVVTSFYDKAHEELQDELLTLRKMLREKGVVAQKRFTKPRTLNVPFYNNYCLRYLQLVAMFVAWYNEEHRHSGLRYVTPAERHAGQDPHILARRHAVYETARQRNPQRWRRNTRNWKPIGPVTLNPERDCLAGKAQPEAESKRKAA